MQAGRGQPPDTLTPEAARLTPARDPLACLPRPSEPEIAQVKWAATGDTIVVDLNTRQRSVRYLGITAPPYRPNIRFTGPPAYLKNQELVQGQIVELYRDGPDADAQGQLLRYVVTHGLFVNLELARLGLAQVDPSPAGGELACAALLRQAEQAAQAAQVGLWGQSAFAAAPSATHAATRTPANTPGRTAIAAASTATSSQAAGAPTVTPTTPTPPVSATSTATSAPTNTPVPGETPSATPPPTATSPPPTAPPPTATNPPPVVGPPSSTPRFTATTTYLDIIITDLNFEGDPAKNEADEYVEISNDGETPVNLLGWKLVSENTGVTFTFPSFIIQPDVVCYVYTNMVDVDSCVNASFGHSTGLWSSDVNECAQLYDSSGHLQDEYCY